MLTNKAKVLDEKKRKKKDFYSRPASAAFNSISSPNKNAKYKIVYKRLLSDPTQ
jgi:hypothetical protein